MGFRLAEIELSEPLAPIRLSAQQQGVALLARWRDRPIGFEMIDLPAGAILSVERLEFPC